MSETIQAEEEYRYALLPCLKELKFDFKEVPLRSITFLGMDDFVDMVSARHKVQAGTQMLEHLSLVVYGCSFYLPFQGTDEGLQVLVHLWDEGLDLHLDLYDDEHLGLWTYIGPGITELIMS